MVGEDIDEGVRADLYARLFKQGVRVETTTAATEAIAGRLTNFALAIHFAVL